jgi:hypothetical protein
MITNFIPTVWSETLLRSLDKRYIGVAHCNREYEGDIKEKGNSVKICGFHPVTVVPYNRSENLNSPQELMEIIKELKIDQAKYFNFQIEDVDRAQIQPKLMEMAMKSAAETLVNVADKYVFSLYNQAGTTFVSELPTPDTILDIFFKTHTQLLKSGITDPNDIVYEISPDISEILLRSKIQLTSNNDETLKSGCIGKILGSEVFVSNNVNYEIAPSASVHHCIARSRRAIAFAEQLSEIVAYRPELRFSDAVKGLHLYGAKTIYPAEMVYMKFVLPGVPED